MRVSLIVLGVIFLVIGAALYFVPFQEFQADTTNVGSGGTGSNVSSASVTVPVVWAYASAIIGFILFFLGLVIPGSESVRTVQGPRGPRGSTGRRNVVQYVQGPRGPRGSKGRSGSRSRRTRGAAVPKGTVVTTTTRYVKK